MLATTCLLPTNVNAQLEGPSASSSPSTCFDEVGNLLEGVDPEVCAGKKCGGTYPSCDGSCPKTRPNCKKVGEFCDCYP